MFFAPVAPTGAAPTGVKGLRLNMDSDFYGRTKVNVSQDGIRIDSEKLGVSIISRPPEWKVFAFNPGAKTYYESTMDKWKQKITQSMSGRHQLKRTVKKLGSFKVAGITTTKYHMDEMTQGGPNSRKRRGAIDVYVSKSLLVPKQAGQIIAGISDLPSDLGLPLRIVRFNRENVSNSMLDTVKSQEMVIPKAMFMPPKGLRRVTSEVALIMETEGDDMADVMDQLSGSK